MRAEIITAIYNKLNGISELTGKVYKFNKSQFDAYPVAVILGSENEKQRESVKTLLKTYRFKVQVLQEVNEEARGQEDGETLLVRLSDIIDNLFDDDDTLGGVCDDVSVTSTFIWEDRELMMRGLDLQIVCRKLKQLT